MWCTWGDGAWPTGLHRLSAPSFHPAAWHHTPRRERLVPSDVPGNFRRSEVSTMAFARITRQWPDDSACVIEVGCESSYPDAVAQCVAEVARLEGLVMPDDVEAEGDQPG